MMCPLHIPSVSPLGRITWLFVFWAVLLPILILYWSYPSSSIFFKISSIFLVTAGSLSRIWFNQENIIFLSYQYISVTSVYGEVMHMLNLSLRNGGRIDFLRKCVGMVGCLVSLRMSHLNYLFPLAKHRTSSFLHRPVLLCYLPEKPRCLTIFSLMFPLTSPAHLGPLFLELQMYLKSELKRWIHKKFV